MNLENTMSRPDYEQTILHHSYLLVLLRGVGPSKPRTLQKAFDKVRGVNNVKITDSNGLIRDIWVRYIHDHPVENNDWGDFQTHRRLLGLVTIGKFETQIELNELCRQHESLKVRYGGTLYESRAIFFGPPIPEEPAIASSSTAVTNHNDLETIKENPCPEIKISLPKRLQDEYTTPSNFKAQAFFYRENDLYEDLETHIVDFVNGLFWILESRRLERSREKPEKCTARNLGQSTLATRHMTFLLQTQWHNMKPKEQSEMAVQLKNLSAQCEGSPVPLFLENGTVIPPANLTDIPYCLDFSVKDLPAHLRPQRLKIDKAESGPFLFTPLQFNSIDRRDKNKDKNKIAFCWVQNNVSEVAVRLRNPLPFEVIVNDMRLLTNGTVFKSLSQTITLQPHAPTNVTLHGTPLEVGQLDIQGYSTHTLGVKSNCRLKHMKDRKFPLNYLVNVIPALPCISVKTSLPQTATFSNLANKDLVITSASLTLYNGESSSCVITVTNESLVPIEHLELNVTLPLRGGSPNSFQQIQMQSKRNDTGYSSFRSIPSSAHQSAAALNLSPLVAGLTAINSSKPVEAQLRLKYSGGEALPEGYCRQCAISFNLEFLSSAQITSWDVLPAEIPSQFYLVLDITNLTAQEMSLNYTNHKNILIEAKESCRVPIPVDRCSLEQVYAVREAEIAENLEKELCFRSQTVSFNDSVSRLCSKHIAERVKINWLLTGTNIRGIASLKGIILTQPMIDLCTVSPLQWSILFKNQPMQPQSEIICVAGQSSILSIDVRNQSLHPLRNLTLTIKFYQDYLNGIENYSLETRVAVSGPNRVHIPILQKDQKVHHECSVLFFTPGRFKTSIQCHAKPQPIYNQSLSRSCPVPQQMSSDLQVTLNNVNIATQSYHEQQEHIWKFIPPIEVTVVDHQ
uniref:Uncharacterized protein n=1 Tax=Glossina pallidipes TaxID=7398 RepID=A0A1B0A401_GLOPL